MILIGIYVCESLGIWHALDFTPWHQLTNWGLITVAAKKMAGSHGCFQLGPPLTTPPTTPFPRICVPGAGKALKAFAGDVGEGVWSLNDSVGAPVFQLPGSDGMMLQGCIAHHFIMDDRCHFLRSTTSNKIIVYISIGPARSNSNSDAFIKKGLSEIEYIVKTRTGYHLQVPSWNLADSPSIKRGKTFSNDFKLGTHFVNISSCPCASLCAMAVDSAEEDLIELLSCHRSDAWFNQKPFTKSYMVQLVNLKLFVDLCWIDVIFRNLKGLFHGALPFAIPVIEKNGWDQMQHLA